MAKANGGTLTLAGLGDVSIEVIVGYTHFGSYYLYEKKQVENGWVGELLAEGNSVDAVRDVHNFARAQFNTGDVIEWSTRLHPMSQNPNYILSVIFRQGHTITQYDYDGQFTPNTSGATGRVIGDYVVIA